MLTLFNVKYTCHPLVSRVTVSIERKKYIIGLTGNIGTGKTVVRKMLERLGAYTIDADGLSHRAIARGAPGYEPVLSTFGKWIIDANGDVNRSKLGNLVFRDQAALAELEKIIHPLRPAGRQSADRTDQRTCDCHRGNQAVGRRSPPSL